MCRLKRKESKIMGMKVRVGCKQRDLISTVVQIMMKRKKHLTVLGRRQWVMCILTRHLASRFLIFDCREYFADVELGKDRICYAWYVYYTVFLLLFVCNILHIFC